MTIRVRCVCAACALSRNLRLQLKLPAMSGDPAPTMTHLFAAGGTAGFMYWVLFYPLDVIKSAMQTDALVPSERKFRGIAHATSCLWKEGGVSRFYKGVTPCLLRAVPANAIMLITVVRLRFVASLLRHGVLTRGCCAAQTQVRAMLGP